MHIETTPLEGLCIVQLDVIGDSRGFFMERYQQSKFKEAGLDIAFIQDNHSRSRPGTLRGLHYQFAPPQGKLVGVVSGRIWDVAVDIRPESATYGQYFGLELSDINGKLLYIPAGFAHGFCVLGDEPADVMYKVDQYYHPKGEKGIRYDDPDINIPWPMTPSELSTRDETLMSFHDYSKQPDF